MNTITKENILSAIDEIKKNGVSNRQSSTYDLIHEDKSYPPKLVVSIANRFATGKELDHNTFKGGKNTPAFELLNRQGFKIVPKKTTNIITSFASLIPVLKEYLKNSDSSVSEFTIHPHKNRAKYVWISDNKNIIGDYNCHYELIERKDNDNNKRIYIEIHFEDKFKTKYFENLKDNLPNKAFWNNSHKAGKSITYKSNYSYDDLYLLSKIEDSIIYLEKKLGDKLRKIKGMKYSVQQMQEMFKTYLERNLTPKSVSNYLSAIPSISKLTLPNLLIDESLYEIQSPNTLDEFLSLLKNNDEYFQLNVRGNSMYSSSLNYYNFFINELNISVEESSNYESMNLNQILYGPPGTGKTYKLQNEFFEKFTLKESSVSKDQFLENLVSELSWWQVITIAVFDLKTAKVNDIYNHKIIKVKEKLSDSNTIRHTIWGQLQRHTILDCPNVNARERSEPLYFSKDKNSNWTIDHELLDQYYPEALDILKSIQNFTGNEGIVVKNYDFVTFHQSFSYEDFIEGIKPRLEDGETELGFEIKDGVFKKLCLKAEADPNSNYAIFIDEINRGNVSAIFGELITLIEEDKRLSAKNELKIKLPYSKREFGVPSNLYIVGTMNTADRSVEALDTALRRRFCFVEMMPDLKVVADKNFTDYDRVQIMEKINQRVELLLDRNYTLGHSYFIKDHFKSSFENEIIPLLQEYFYNDCGKIGLVLGKGFVREKEISKNNSISIFADFDTKNEVDIIKSYELIPFSEIDFKIAIETLLA
jgi:Cdc6-like AAA superfamily ATPase